MLAKQVRLATLSHVRAAEPVEAGRNRFYQMLQRKAWISRVSTSAEKPKTLKRSSELRAKSIDPKTGKIRFSTFSKPTKETLRRTRMKWKRRRPKPGDDPAYKAWIRRFPCVVGGKRCGQADPHHIIDGTGDQRKGMAQTAADKDCFPLCRRHHDDLHDGTGFCKGWSKEKRRTFQEQEIERFNEMWRDQHELGVLQEPERKAI